MSIHPESAGTIEAGTVIAETYEVTHLIGRGGMGAVWAANHMRLPGSRVAVKVLLADIAGDTDSLARFRREAEIASKLGHPNIVQVIDFNTLPDGAPYLVLELLTGESLDSRLARGPLSMSEAMTVVRQMGSGLHAAHREGVIHRDLKPQNIFLCPTEMGGDIHTQVKVLDFGISKIRGSQTIKTQESTILGTPQYMAPEQATGAHDKVDARTDVFAFGAIVYEMLSGMPAFSGQSVPEVVFKVVYEEAPPLADIAPTVPEVTRSAIEKALAKKRDERFATVSEFVEALTGRPLVTLRGHTPVPELLKVPEQQFATAETQHVSSSTDPMAQTVISGEHDHKVDGAQMPMPSAAGVVGTGKSQDASAYAETMATTGTDLLEDLGKTDSVAPPAKPHKASRAPLFAVLAIVVLGGSAGLLYALSGSDAKPAAEKVAKKRKRPPPVKTPPATPVIAPPDAAPAVAVTAPDAAPATATVAETEAGTETGTETEAETAKKVPRRDPPPPSEEPASKDLLAAEKALRSGDASTALRLAKRSLLEHPTGLRAGRAHAIIAISYCLKSDFGNARASLRKVPRRLKRRVIRACADADIDL